MCKHFFLIDDDEDELEIFMEALSQLPVPCKCTYAKSAEQALEILNYLKPDIVFVDSNMPHISGLECVKRIRAKQGHDQTKLVIYSNGIADLSTHELISCGATSFLQKTSTISGLVSGMQRLINSPQLDDNILIPAS